MRWSSSSSAPRQAHCRQFVGAVRPGRVLEFEGSCGDVNQRLAVRGVAIERSTRRRLQPFRDLAAPQPPVAAADQLGLMRIIIADGPAVRSASEPVALTVRGSVGSVFHQHFFVDAADPPFLGRNVGGRHDCGGGVPPSRDARGPARRAGILLRAFPVLSGRRMQHPGSIGCR